MARKPETASPAYTVENAYLSKLYLASEAPADLALDVRKAPDDPGAFATLKALVKAEGLLQPLIVKAHKGRLYVLSGNRRLRALRELATEDGLAPGSYTVPVVDLGERDASPAEIALMANVSLPMHPVDRYEALAACVNGTGHDDLAARWGLTATQVRQTLALGGLSPKVREAWRAGKIDASTAQAFTLSPDVPQQDKILAKALKQGWINERVVRSEIVGDHREAGNWLTFIGDAAYEAAGGSVHRDLFGNDHRVSDYKLLKRMVDNKIEQEIDVLTKGDGAWAWAMRLPPDSYQFGRIEPKRVKYTEDQKAELAGIRAKLKAKDDDGEESDDLRERHDAIESAAKLASFTAEERAKSGVFIILRNGVLELDAGRIRPDEAKAERARQSAAERKKKKAKAGKDGEAPAADVSSALMERMSHWLTEAAAQAIKAGSNETALHILLAALLAGGGQPCDVRMGGLSLRKRPTLSFAEALKRASNTVSEDMFCDVVASALDLESRNPDRPPLDDENIRALCAFLDAELMAEALHKAFDANDYFASISKAAIVAAVMEMGCSDDQVKAIDHMKKDEAAETAATLARAREWLPPQLRVPALKAAPKSAKKKAPKRRR